MRQLKILVMALVLDLTLFFNLERLSFGDEYYHFLNIQSFVYAVGLGAVIATIWLRLLWKNPVYLSISVWLGIYLAGKLVLFPDPAHPLVGGLFTFITVTEVTLIALSIFIAHAVAVRLSDFEQAVENITFNGSTRRLRRLEDAVEDVRTEILRSRRYKTPLAVIVVEPWPDSIRATLNRAVQEVQKAMMSRYVITAMATTLTRTMRRTDMVLQETGKNRFIILTPETDASEVALLCDHIQASVMSQMSVRVKCGAAHFPGDAVTFEELVQKAEQSLPGEPVQIPAPIGVAQSEMIT